MASLATARAIERRRSTRFVSKVTLVLSRESAQKQLLQERVLTLSVNAHGALIALTGPVTVGEKVLLMNSKTWSRTEGRVIRLLPLQGEWTLAAIEFARLAPEFTDSPKRSQRPRPR
jgi:hypothetical protein